MFINNTSSIISGFTNSFIASNIFSYSQEICKGNIQNKIFQGFILYSFLSYTFSPFYLLYSPTVLDPFYYTIATCIGLSCYYSSILHKNQIHKNNNQLDKTTQIMFELHNSEYFIKINKLFLNYAHYLMFTSYFVCLVILASQGLNLNVISSLITLFTDLLYQNGYFNQITSNIYMYLTTTILNLSIFLAPENNFLANILAFSYSIITLANNFFSYNKGLLSSSVQFPCAVKNYQINNVLDQSKIIEASKLLINEHTKNSPFYLTFEHMHKCREIYQRKLKNIKPANFDEFLELFDRANFHDSDIQDIVNNHLVDHEGFNSDSLDSYRKKLNLPINTNDYDVKIQYLRKEMVCFVERLKQKRHGDLLANQVADLHSYAILLLNFLKDPNKCSNNLLQRYLFQIASETGSHCNRMYLESLSNMVSNINNDISIQDIFSDEETILKLQNIRDTKFKEYFYIIRTRMRFYNYFYDKNDYHNYENFSSDFGCNFFLSNTSLNSNFQSLNSMLFDRFTNFFFKKNKIRFNDFYSVDYILNQMLSESSTLFKNFQNWCKNKNLNILNEYYLFEIKDEIKGYALLMLLELNIISHNSPELNQKLKNILEKTNSDKAKFVM